MMQYLFDEAIYRFACAVITSCGPVLWRIAKPVQIKSEGVSGLREVLIVDLIV